MTREEVLREFLNDHLFTEKKYLKQNEADIFKWMTPTSVKLIEVIKLAIDDEISGESQGVTEKKINKYLNQ